MDDIKIPSDLRLPGGHGFPAVDIEYDHESVSVRDATCFVDLNYKQALLFSASLDEWLRAIEGTQPNDGKPIESSDFSNQPPDVSRVVLMGFPLTMSLAFFLFGFYSAFCFLCDMVVAFVKNN